MYKINFNHLYYFLTIAKEGSIVKASKKLHLTQPALSHQLKLLELDLGKKLFDRKGRRLVINTDGEAVLDYAEKIFRNSEEMIQYLKSDTTQSIKIVKIGVIPWLSNEQIHDFIKPLLTNQYIKVEVYQKDLESLISDVQSNRLDIILCDSPYSGRSKKLQGVRLRVEPIYCVSSKKVKGLFPRNLDNQKLISFSETSIMADKIEQFLMNHKLKTLTAGAYTDSSLIRTTLEKTTLIGFLPKSAVKESLRTKKLVKIGELKSYKFSIWAITKKGRSRDDMIQKVIKQFKD